MSRFTKLKLLALTLIVGAVGAASSAVLVAQQSAPQTINAWWPLNNAQLIGQQPFKAELSGADVESYRMYWSVDNGSWNYMPTVDDGLPHKEITVDVTNWNWKGSGPYAITYSATDLEGNLLSQKTVTLKVGAIMTAEKKTADSQVEQLAAAANAKIKALADSVANATKAEQLAANAASTAAVAKLNSNTAALVSNGSPISGFGLYASPLTPAARQAQEWRQTRPADAARMDRLAAQSSAKWFGGWNQNVEADTMAYTSAAKAANTLPTLVAYNIPQRDCGSHSAGGSATGAAYLEWIRSISRGVGANPAVVILEPDALGGMDCLNATDRSLRLNLLTEAVAILKSQPATYVYIDAGHPRWHKADVMASRLQDVDIARADGFSLNVSNFITTQENIEYGTSLSAQTGGKHFVIDTSRNGVGPSADSEWCNPADRALGQSPSTKTSSALVDAYLWLKTPGESDGACNGGAAAGSWWPEYALGLAKRAGW